MNTGRPALSAARSEPAGTFISNTMMVMMMAITPSVNASSRCLLTFVLYLRDVQPNIGIQTRFSESHPPTPHTQFLDQPLRECTSRLQAARNPELRQIKLGLVILDQTVQNGPRNSTQEPF